MGQWIDVTEYESILGSIIDQLSKIEFSHSLDCIRWMDDIYKSGKKYEPPYIRKAIRECLRTDFFLGTDEVKYPDPLNAPYIVIMSEFNKFMKGSMNYRGENLEELQFNFYTNEEMMIEKNVGHLFNLIENEHVLNLVNLDPELRDVRF